MASKRDWDKVINHWTRLSTGKRRKFEDIGSESCRFCQKYFEYDCIKCPIKQETTLSFCCGTPYDDAEDFVHRYLGEGDPLDNPLFLKLAQKELDFLLELRKKVRGD